MFLLKQGNLALDMVAHLQHYTGRALWLMGISLSNHALLSRLKAGRTALRRAGLSPRYFFRISTFKNFPV